MTRIELRVLLRREGCNEAEIIEALARSEVEFDPEPQRQALKEPRPILHLQKLAA